MPSGSGTPVPTTAPSNEAPSPPTALTAQWVSSGVLLQWSAPAKTYGLPIDGYAVYLSNGQGWAVQNDSDTDTALVAPEPTAIDRSCQNAQSCVYEVRAFTAAGPSGPSNGPRW